MSAVTVCLSAALGAELPLVVKQSENALCDHGRGFIPVEHAQPAAGGPLVIEAEDVSRLSLQVAAFNNSAEQFQDEDAQASGGRFIAYVDQAWYALEITTPGKYQVWYRSSYPWRGWWNHSESIDLPDVNGGRVDDAAIIAESDPRKGRWIWTRGPVYEFSAGKHTHTLNFNGGARIDQILYTPNLSTNAPSAVDEAALPVTGIRKSAGKGTVVFEEVRPGPGLTRWEQLVDAAQLMGGRIKYAVSTDGGKTWLTVGKDGRLAELPVKGDGTDALTVRAALTCAPDGRSPVLRGVVVRFQAAGKTAVKIEKRATEYIVSAASYRAILDPTGALQSLVIGQTEFLAPKTYKWMGQNSSGCGRVHGDNQPFKLEPLRRVSSQTEDRIKAEGDQWSLEYHFLAEDIWFTISGVIEGIPFDGYPQKHFCLSISPALARACDTEKQGEVGWPLNRPFDDSNFMVLDKTGAGIMGLPQCNFNGECPLLMTFPAESPGNKPVSFRLHLSSQADLAHALKIEVLSPNPDHFFIGSNEAEFPVSLEALYGKKFKGKLRFEGTPFVWGQPRVESVADVDLTERSKDTVKIKIAVPKPGQYTGMLSLCDGERKLASKRIGFITAPEKIPPAPVPADFDQFWDTTLAELEKIPLDLELTPVPDMNSPQGDVFKAKFRSWGGRWAWAWLHVPKADKKAPGNVTCPPVGTYQPGPARPYCGELRIYASVHGGDIADDSHRTDFDYLNTGITSREDYMLRYSYCCLVRCFDIIRNQPKCNSTINVWGGSQGGGLTLVLGGLRPATSLAGHNIALCRIDWTILGLTRWGPQLPKGEDPQKIAAIVAYYDPARFTHRIHSAVKLCFGLFDWCAPGEGIMSAVNGLPKDTRVEVFADPFGDHFHSTYERANKGAPAIEIPRWQGTDADNKVSNQPRQ